MRTKQDLRKQEMRNAKLTKPPLQTPKMHNTKTAPDIKTALCNLLNRFEGGGSFATGGLYSEAPLPDLFLEGYGSIPLPLAERDVEGICRERREGEDGMYGFCGELGWNDFC